MHIINIMFVSFMLMNEAILASVWSIKNSFPDNSMSLGRNSQESLDAVNCFD